MRLLLGVYSGLIPEGVVKRPDFELNKVCLYLIVTFSPR